MVIFELPPPGFGSQAFCAQTVIDWLVVGMPLIASEKTTATVSLASPLPGVVPVTGELIEDIFGPTVSTTIVSEPDLTVGLVKVPSQ
jgi:hypothetical protein